MEQDKINEKAHEIYQWLQDAVGDMAYGLEVSDIESYYGKKIGNKVKKMKREGYDWKGWLADEFYNDVGTLQDLSGDRIYDAVTQLGVKSLDKELFDETFCKIAKSLKEQGHPALQRACNKLIKRRSN